MNSNRHRIAPETTCIWSLGHCVIRILITALLCAYPANTTAEKTGQAYEYEAKIALLYNFAKFTVWPKDAFENDDSPFIFAVLGKNPFGDAFSLLRDKKIGGRSIEMRHFSEPLDFVPCQILYCTLTDFKRFTKVHPNLLEQQHVLTVGEQDEFVKKDGILLLLFVDDHLAFKVNTKAARSAGIEISATLLRLATEIIKE
ncbi:MAG: hypothetical protein ACI8V2_000514 [Candidatus Latescibacterota bacterium]